MFSCLRLCLCFWIMHILPTSKYCKLSYTKQAPIIDFTIEITGMRTGSERHRQEVEYGRVGFLIAEQPVGGKRRNR